MSTLEAKTACARTDSCAPGSPLHAVTKRAKRGRRYCGPSAVCIVTGAEYGEVTRIIREKTGARAVMGTSTFALAPAFHALGWRLDDRGPDEGEPRPTLARWARERSPGDRAVYLVNVTRHWVVVRGDEAGDSITGAPVPLAEFGCVRKRVRRVYRVRPGADHRSMLKPWVWDEWRLTERQRMDAAIRRSRGDYS